MDMQELEAATVEAINGNPDSLMIVVKVDDKFINHAIIADRIAKVFNHKPPMPIIVIPNTMSIEVVSKPRGQTFRDALLMTCNRINELTEKKTSDFGPCYSCNRIILSESKPMYVVVQQSDEVLVKMPMCHECHRKHQSSSDEFVFHDGPDDIPEPIIVEKS